MNMYWSRGMLWAAHGCFLVIETQWNTVVQYLGGIPFQRIFWIFIDRGVCYGWRTGVSEWFEVKHMVQWQCKTPGPHPFNNIFCWGRVLLTHWCSAEQSYREVVSGRWKLPSTQNIFFFFSNQFFVNFDKTKKLCWYHILLFFLARLVLGGISTMILAATITKMFRYLWYW